MKYFTSSTLAAFCVLVAGMQVLGKAVHAESASNEISTREPSKLAQYVGGEFDTNPANDEVDVTDELNSGDIEDTDVEERDGEAAGFFWPPRRRPIRIIRPVYIRPRPRRRPRRPRRRPHRNINVNGANGGTNIGGNGANGGNIRVRARDVEEKRETSKREEEQYRRPGRVNVSGANGGYNYGGNGANGGKINVNTGRGRRGGRGGKTNVRGANGGTNYYGNGANGGSIRVNRK